MHKYFSLLFISSLSLLHSQELTKKLPGNVSVNDYFKSPSAWNFTDYSNENLVDLYTGMVDINIPVFEVSEKDLKVPIVLKYKKDGIKVKEISGRVGLGWDLIAGGYIKREVRGNPDEEIKAVSPSTGNEYYQNIGRFVDLMEYIYPPAQGNNQIPLGNTQGDKYMDYYIDLIVNNNIGNCDLIREYDYYESLRESLDRENFCKSCLFDAIKNSPHISAFYNADGHESDVIYFWNKYRDTQPDIFHYSVPDASGSFILDSNGNAKIISGSKDVLITPGIGPQRDQEGWKIITPNGVINKFQTTIDYTETTSVEILNSPGLTSTPVGTTGSVYIGYEDDSLTKEEFKQLPSYFNSSGSNIFRIERESVNTWYLSSIRSSKYDSEIIFEYNSQGEIEEYDIEETRMDYIRTKYKYYSQDYSNLTIEPSHSVTYDNGPIDLYGYMALYADPTRGYYFPILKKIKNPKYLSKIIFSAGEVNLLNQSNYRFDLPLNYALDKILVKDNNSKTIKGFKFDYDYFIEFPYVNTNESTRLKLDGFFELNGNDVNKKYIFEYNEHLKLPPQNSKSQDYWGYFNNNSSNSLIPEGHRHFKDFTGADRLPNENKMKVWMLNRINYPTGGYNEISYEMNVHKSNYDGIERPVGGLRVFQTKTHDGVSSNNDIIKNYSYQNGRSVNLLDSNWWRHFQSDSHFFEYLNNDQNPSQLRDFHFIKRSSSIMYPIIQTKGGWVGYERVIVNSEGNGRTEYVFNNPESSPDELGEKTKFPYINQNGSDNYHDTNHISKEALRGFLKSEWTYSEENKLLLYIQNEYTENPQNTNQFVANVLQIEPEFSMSVQTGFGQGFFAPIPILREDYYKHSLNDLSQIRAYFPYLSRKTIRKYDMDDNVYNETVYNYKHGSLSHMQITEALTNTSEGDEVKIKYYYPGDNHPEQFLSPSEISSVGLLSSQNRTEPILIEEFLNSSHIKRRLNTFKTETNKVLLKAYKTSKGNNNSFIEELIYKQYDSFGNLVEASKANNGTDHFTIWGYNKQYPIAEIVNFGTTQITSQIQALIDAAVLASDLDDDRTIGDFGNEGQLRQTQEALRNTLNAHNIQITTYTYDPLIGMTSHTDPRGNIMYYEYDNFNRLKQVKDADGKILSENRYHYKGQQ